MAVFLFRKEIHSFDRCERCIKEWALEDPNGDDAQEGNN